MHIYMSGLFGLCASRPCAEPRKDHTVRNLPTAAWKLPGRRLQNAVVCRLCECVHGMFADCRALEPAGCSIVPPTDEDRDTARSPVDSIRLTVGYGEDPALENPQIQNVGSKGKLYQNVSVKTFRSKLFGQNFRSKRFGQDVSVKTYWHPNP